MLTNTFQNPQQAPTYQSLSPNQIYNLLASIARYIGMPGRFMRPGPDIPFPDESPKKKQEDSSCSHKDKDALPKDKEKEAPKDQKPSFWDRFLEFQLPLILIVLCVLLSAIAWKEYKTTLFPPTKTLSTPSTEKDDKAPLTGMKSTSSSTEAPSTLSKEAENQEARLAALTSLLEEHGKLLKQHEDALTELAKTKSGSKKPRQRSKSAEQANPLKSWDILGYSHDRIIVETATGAHMLKIGESIDGITLKSIDTKTGTIRTSHGTLHYDS